MTAKACFRCGETRDLSEFYTHEEMADGHLNKCKSCCRSEAVKNRLSKISYYREYDRKRFATDRRRAFLAERQRRYRAANPGKTAARSAVSRALRSGELVRGRCEVCGSDAVDAHHDDYGRPLNVRWLCRVHHLFEHGNYIQ